MTCDVDVRFVDFFCPRKELIYTEGSFLRYGCSRVEEISRDVEMVGR